MTEKRKSELAYRAVAKWANAIAPGLGFGENPDPTAWGDGAQPAIFVMGTYAARVTGRGKWWAISVWDRRGRFVTNIAA